MTYNVFSGTLNPTHSLTHPGKEAIKLVLLLKGMEMVQRTL